MGRDVWKQCPPKCPAARERSEFNSELWPRLTVWPWARHLRVYQTPSTLREYTAHYTQSYSLLSSLPGFTRPKFVSVHWHRCPIGAIYTFYNLYTLLGYTRCRFKPPWAKTKTKHGSLHFLPRTRAVWQLLILLYHGACTRGHPDLQCMCLGKSFLFLFGRGGMLRGQGL